jgi:general secretion pathway protein E
LAERCHISTPQLRVAKGCEACGGTGYKGRVAVAEYLRCDERIRAMPKGPEFLTEARQYARAQGWRTLVEDGFVKAMRGVTTLDEVLRVAG